MRYSLPKTYIKFCIILSVLFLPIILSSSELAGYPYLAYSNETGLMFGGFAFYKTADPNKEPQPSDINFSILTNSLYTTKHQFLVAVVPQLQRIDRNWKLDSSIALKLWPDNYYGLGNFTNADDAEGYEDRYYEIDSSLQKSLFQSFSYLILNSVQGYHQYRKVSPDGQLSDLVLPGKEDSFYSGIGPGLLIDNTDHYQYPTQGFLFKTSHLVFDKKIGSEYNYSKSLIDLRGYLPLGSSTVLAAQTELISYRGTVPVYNYLELGNRLRAYDSKRFTERTRIVQRIEQRTFPFRSGVKSRTGFVVFYEIGQVSPSIGGIRLKDWHSSYGLGFRFNVLPKERLNLRCDLGFSSDGVNVIINARETF